MINKKNCNNKKGNKNIFIAQKDNSKKIRISRELFKSVKKSADYFKETFKKK